jgi:glycosyltransferase involved in cell wall biosynthesis
MLDMNEFPDLESVRDRVVTVSMLPYHQMIEDLRNCDVVISPLVPGNPFCESKSELKFFEAALVGRPCVASATSTYETAMEMGRYGFTAKTDDDWFKSLSALYISPQFRRQLAKAARDYVRGSYSYSVAGREAAAAYFGIPRLEDAKPKPSRGQRIKDALSIGIIIPSIVVGGGGHRKILKFCHDWAQLGILITLYVDGSEHPAQIRQQIYTHFFTFDCDIKTFRGSVGHHDVIVCTHWKTAFALRQYATPKKIIYFVQDFEPMFDAVNSNYVKAIATYRFGFNIACYGQWVADRLRRELDIGSTIVPFSMDKQLYRSMPRVAKVVDVLFFARPSQPRRCFELGVDALKRVFKANRSVRIGLYGEEAYGELGFPYHNFGLIKNVSKLAELYGKSKLGICFSTTNPSLVGYEMIACGLPLVDLRLPGCEVNFSGEDFVYYADPTPEAIFASLAKALNNEEDRAHRASLGMTFASAMPEDTVIGERLFGMVEQICTESRQGT